jgi:hypothetical protein
LPNGPAKFLPFAARKQFAGSFLQEYTGKGAGRKQHAGKTATFEDVEALLTSNRRNAPTENYQQTDAQRHGNALLHRTRDAHSRRANNPDFRRRSFIFDWGQV